MSVELETIEQALRNVTEEQMAKFKEVFARALASEMHTERQIILEEDGGEVTMGWETPEVADEFVLKSYEVGLIVSFDWMSWVDERQMEDIEIKNRIEAVRMLTSLVRADRFVEGALVAGFSNGTMRRVYEGLFGVRSR